MREERFQNVCRVGLLLGSALLTSCRTLPPRPAPPPRTIQFMLTFDDGPSIRKPYNPTLAIMNQLATNDIQPGIKAIFFVQTGHPRGGGTPEGREIMRRLAADGQILGIHSVSHRGHVDHRKVPPAELTASLKEAKDILRNITGADPLFVRPPFGAKNLTTQTIYAELGLHMLMADIRARDGLIYGYNGSLFRRVHIHNALATLREESEPPGSPGEPFSVILNFHDVNPYTARHMTEYLHILVEEAQRVGFIVPAHPFFDSAKPLSTTALHRCIPPPLIAMSQNGVSSTPNTSEK